MTVSAKIILDSISPQGDRITTFQLRYPKYIHGEFMTHRVFSRNASSSRAIPLLRMIEDVKGDTTCPEGFGENQRGMQAGDDLDHERQGMAKDLWQHAREIACDIALQMHGLGVHKQHVNRILEPFAHINTLVTATTYSNFFALRRHSDAQPEIHELADCMWNLYSVNEPDTLAYGAWHLPYLTLSEGQNYVNEKLIPMSVARCARVSYLTHDQKFSTLEQDQKLFDQLVGAYPMHASPAEHVAQAVRYGEPDICGNFTGWAQYRKMLVDENITGAMYSQICEDVS